jgi:SET domain-containing protein
MITHQNGYVASAGKKGRGVFAKKRIKTGELIEISPFIELPSREFHRFSDTIIDNYRFEVKGNRCAIGLGHTSIYNHDEEPNAEFSIQAKRRTITIKAIKTIQRGEEITINYGYEVS